MTTQPQHLTVASRGVPAESVHQGSSLPGVLLFLLGTSFLTVTMLAASVAPAYDFNRAAISDLGVIDATALMFNGLLVAVGALNIAGGFLLYRSHGHTWILVTYLLAGIGAAGAGLVPLDASGLHSLFALVGFVFFNLEAVASATIVQGPMRAISWAAGLIGLVFVVVMVIGDAGNAAVFGAIGHGGSERMIVYPAMLWTIAFGGYRMAGGAIRPRVPGPRDDA